MTSRPLIVGAGPVGLGAALFLKRSGIDVRIIDVAGSPTRQSKALAINPRTLEILEPTGMTSQLLKHGLRIRGAQFRVTDRVTREISFGRLPHKYPFMLALSQATTERLLNDALAAAGQAVERGVEMVSCRNVAEGVEAVLRHPSDREETYHCPWLLACDGAHSTARQCLGIDFEGSKFERPWHLADLPLRTDLEHDLAHVEFLKGGGFVFLIRVVNEAADRTSKRGLWRVMSNCPDPVSRLSRAEPAGKPVWTSQFYISHRINRKLRAGNVYFAGDAAHVHSPVGARGMNLGLEDAAVFSHLARRHGLERYEASRRSCDRRVVNQIELLSRMVMAESFGARVARALFMRWLIKAPFVRNTMLARVTGLDHDVELGNLMPFGNRP